MFAFGGKADIPDFLHGRVRLSAKADIDGTEIPRAASAAVSNVLSFRLITAQRISP
jgi:hypothetical protein